jgi:hypothetical protein
MAGLSYIPSAEETALRKQIEADHKRLAGGAGGMSEGRRQQALAGMASGVQAQQQQALAQLARGSAMGGGESGISTAKQLGVIGAGQQAMMQGVGQLREQDLMAAQQQRALNAQQLQYLAQMEMARRQAAIQQANQALGLTPAQQQEAGAAGQGERTQLAQGVQGLAGNE